MRAPLPESEDHRLRTLRLHHILDTAAEKSFDDLTRLAATICDVPISLISLVDESRQWFKARVGIEAEETSRESSFCAHAILKDELMIVSDALTDVRFADNPLVLGDPKIRFYAGAPLTVSNGESLGTLCVIDTVPRLLTKQQLLALDVLRDSVVNLLEVRRAVHDLEAISQCLPVCAWCRSVRDPDGKWETLDDFVRKNTRITHGICPSCREHNIEHPQRVAAAQQSQMVESS